MSDFQNNLPEVRGKYRFDVKLGQLCWFNAGGDAAVVFIPADAADLQKFLKEIDKEVPIFVFGVGSNLLIRDGGFNGVVIRLLKGEFTEISRDDNIITAGAGVLDVNVSTFALEHEIGGMEFLSGIPGTIGGAIAMNAGAYGGDIAEIVEDITAINYSGDLRKFSCGEMQYKYRGNNLDGKWVFINAKLIGFHSDKDIIKEKILTIQNSRQSTQPVQGYKTGGSTFKNPTDAKAWELIDKAGCRGLKVGNAQMSDLHCNFLINNGGASANDIESLIELVQKKVFEASSYQLEHEIVIIGDK